MADVLVGIDGHIALPEIVRKKYHLTPETPIRLIETRSGILLVPITDEPMGDELAQELAEWQALSLECWDRFPYVSAKQ